MRRKRVMLVSCAVFIICALLYHFTRPPDPVYEGRKLSEWLEDLEPRTIGSGNIQFYAVLNDAKPSHNKAVEAIQKIGKIGLPYLENQLLKDENLLYKHSPSAISQLLNITRKRELDFEPCLFACYVLGPEAASLAPALLRHELNYSGSMLMESVWERIGPAAAPYLIEQIQGRNRERSEFAAYALAQLRPVTDEIVFFFADSMTNSNKIISENALRCFQGTTNHFDRIVPLAVRCLGDKDDYVRLLSLMVIEVHAVNANTTKDEVISALNDRSYDVRRAATNTLHAITSAPSAASTPATPP